MYFKAIPRFSDQATVAPLMYSGQLSTIMASGMPRHSMIWFRVRFFDELARSEGKEESISMVNASRLKLSMTLNNRMLLPSIS